MGKKKVEDNTFQYPALAKDNMLIGSKYKASLLELRVTYASLMMIQEKAYHEEPDGYYVDMPAAQLAEIIGTSNGSFYKNLKNVASHMTNRTFGVEDDESEKFDFINLIIEAKYENNVFTVVFNKKMQDHIMNLTSDFTSLPKSLMMKLNSEYSFRLYEILKKSCYYPKTYTGQRNGIFRVDMGLSELKLSIGVVNSALDSVQNELKKSPHPDYDKAVEKSSEQLYKEWGDFKKRCLDTPIKEINEKTDIQISYEPKRQGKGGRVYAIRFNVYRPALDMTKSEEDVQPATTVEDGVAKVNLDNNEKFIIWNKVFTLFDGTKLQFNDIEIICETADYDYSRIVAAKKLLDGQDNVRNVTGWMIESIKKDYHAVSEEKKPTKKNSFTDFHQREYSNEDLERMLLNS